MLKQTASGITHALLLAIVFIFGAGSALAAPGDVTFISPTPGQRYDGAPTPIELEFTIEGSDNLTVQPTVELRSGSSSTGPKFHVSEQPVRDGTTDTWRATISTDGLYGGSYGLLVTGSHQSNPIIKGITIHYYASELKPFTMRVWGMSDFVLPVPAAICNDEATCNFFVEWGDSGAGSWDYALGYGDNVTPNSNGIKEYKHTFTDTTRTYDIKIYGNFPGLRYGTSYGDSAKEITEIRQWGDIAWQSMEDAFNGARNLKVVATDTPNLENVTSLRNMFANASALDGGGNWNWDTSKVTNMHAVFYSATNFNGDISGWDTSNVTRMFNMFSGASAFNQNIGHWDTSKVTSMNSMLYRASAFNQDLGRWNLSQVSDMDLMLENSGLSITNYDATLMGWESQSNTPSGNPTFNFKAGGLKYCLSEEARQSLIADKGWAITGDSKDCSQPSVVPELSSPADDAVLKTLTPTFKWMSSSDSDIGGYRVWRGTDPRNLDNSSPFINHNSSSEISFTIPSSRALDDDGYTWVVYVYSKNNVPLAWSANRNFTVDTTSSGSGRSGSRTGGYFRPQDQAPTPVSSSNDILAATLRSANKVFTGYLALPQEE